MNLRHTTGREDMAFENLSSGVGDQDDANHAIDAIRRIDGELTEAKAACEEKDGQIKELDKEVASLKDQLDSIPST